MHITKLQTILNKTLKYYQTAQNLPGLKRLPSDEQPHMVQMLISDLAEVESAIANGNFQEAIKLLAELYNWTEEHELKHRNLQYPGPGEFKQLVK